MSDISPLESRPSPTDPEAPPADLAGARLLLGDRDPVAAAFTATALRAGGASHVHPVHSAQAFLEAADGPSDPPSRWDAAVWSAGPDDDPEALTELLGRWHERRPGAPVVVTAETADPRLAVAALRGRAADLVERADPAPLAAALARVLARPPDPLDPGTPHRAARRMLVVGAHPDDVEIGVGGTIHRRTRSGWDVTVLTLSGGEAGGPAGRRRHEAHRAAGLLGAELVVEDLPDGAVADDRGTVRTIERAVARARPDVVLVHSESDTHQDHRAVHHATLVACREVPRLACYQSPSATVSYRPNRYVELGEADLAAKLAAIGAHRTQAARRWYLEEDLLRATARYWGRFARTRYAEPLELVHDRMPLGILPADHV